MTITPRHKPSLLIGALILLTAFTLLQIFFKLPIDAIPLGADAFYYVSVLPVVYWLGVSLAYVITLASLKCNLEKFIGKWSRLLLVILLFLYLYATPVLLFKYPISWNALSEVSYTLSWRWPAPVSPAPYVWFRLLTVVTEIDYFILVKVYDLFIVMLVTMLMYLIAKEIDAKTAYLAPIVFLSMNLFPLPFHRWSYFFILYTLALFLTMKLIKGKDRRISALTFALLAISVISHPTAIILALIFSIFVLGTFSKPLGTFKNLTILGMLAVIVWFSWHIYVAKGQLDILFHILRKAFLNVGKFSITEEAVLITYYHAGSYQIVGMIIKSLVIFQFISGLSLLLIAMALMNDKKRHLSLPLLLLWVFLSSLVFLAPLIFYHEIGSLADYGSRAYMFALIPYASIVTYSIGLDVNRKLRTLGIAALLGIILSGLITPITLYATIPANTERIEHVNAIEFVVTHFYDEIILRGWPVGLLELVEAKAEHSYESSGGTITIFTKAVDIRRNFYRYAEYENIDSEINIADKYSERIYTNGIVSAYYGVGE